MYLNMQCDICPHATMQKSDGGGKKGERCAFLMLGIVMKKLVNKLMITKH